MTKRLLKISKFFQSQNIKMNYTILQLVFGNFGDICNTRQDLQKLYLRPSQLIICIGVTLNLLQCTYISSFKCLS